MSKVVECKKILMKLLAEYIQEQNEEIIIEGQPDEERKIEEDEINNDDVYLKKNNTELLSVIEEPSILEEGQDEDEDEDTKNLKSVEKSEAKMKKVIKHMSSLLSDTVKSSSSVLKNNFSHVLSSGLSCSPSNDPSKSYHALLTSYGA
jgi:hypothetical protein